MYPSDLSDAEWEKIEPVFRVDYSRGGRPLKYSKREMLNAIFYVAKTGCQWRFLPKDYPPWRRVYNNFRKWQKADVFERLNHRLRKWVRVLAGRDEDPSAAIMDSQSIKTAEKGPRGFDSGKKIKGRKRHILVDTLGLLLGCHITIASLSDKQGAREMLNTFYLPCVQKIWVDQGYDGLPLYALCKDKGIDLELVKRKEEGFKILPKRWIVERTFGWMSRYRRLSKDYEGILSTSQNWCYLSMIRLMIKRIECSSFKF